MSIKRRRHQSLFYLVFIVFSTLFYSVMLGSGALIESNNDVVSSELNRSSVVGDFSSTLLNRRLDKTNRRAQFTLNVIPTVTRFAETEFSFSTEFLGADTNESTVTVQQGDSYYFVVTVENLPEKWSGMKVTINEGIERKRELVSYVTSYKTETSHEVEAINDQDVVRLSIQYEIELKENKLTTLGKEIDNQDRIIKGNLEKIESLEASKKYQTESEVNGTNGQIKLMNEGIVEAERVIQSIETEVTEVQAKISKLELKLKDVGVE